MSQSSTKRQEEQTIRHILGIARLGDEQQIIDAHTDRSALRHIDNSCELDTVLLTTMSLDDEVPVRGYGNAAESRRAVDERRVVGTVPTVLVGGEEIDTTPPKAVGNGAIHVVIEIEAYSQGQI